MSAGRIQMESLRDSGINLDDVEVRDELREPDGLHPDRSNHRRADRAVAPCRIACA